MFRKGCWFVSGKLEVKEEVLRDLFT